MKQLLSGIAVISGLAAGLTGGSPVLADLVSHRAFYSVSLSNTSGTNVVSGVDGVMIMSIERTCDGWIFTQDMKTVIGLQTGDTFEQSALFTSWEALDGRKYRFASRVSAGHTTEILRGQADVDATGAGTAHYRQPEAVEVQLPDGTLFPVSHTIWLIAEAEAGRRQTSRVVFAGSENFEPELVNTFIGESIPATDRGAGLINDFDDSIGWPLTMAFHALRGGSGVPTFEVRAFQLDNGVSTSLRMEFGEFATDMKAERIELIENPACD